MILYIFLFKGLTPTSLTGPVGAKTGNFYKYIEISGQLTGDVASLETSVSFNGKDLAIFIKLNR